jgi:16S rRNA (uracil1498-N3)-methyltransferase
VSDARKGIPTVPAKGRGSAVLRVPVFEIEEGRRVLAKEAATYVARVHRLGPGEHFLVFDPDKAVEADAELLELASREVTVAVGPPRPAPAFPGRHVTLIQGIGKGDKMDMIVRDATELGVAIILPVVCERSIARPGASRRERWRRIAVEAARQCGRGDAPEIAPVQSLDAALRWPRPRGEGNPGCLFCMSPEADIPFGERLRLCGQGPALVAVGPEGGVSPRELDVLRDAGFAAVSLGALVLRTETVSAAVLGAIRAWDQAFPLGQVLEASS